MCVAEYRAPTLQHAATHCNTLPHTHVRTWKLREIQRVAVCCSVLRCVAVCCNVLQCVAVCCSVLRCSAVRCSVWQCVAVCCGVLQ